MSYYNHFSNKKYKSILFSSIPINGKFRNDVWKGKRRRKDIIMIKISDNSYMEQKSKKVYNIVYPEKLEVYSYDELL